MWRLRGRLGGQRGNIVYKIIYLLRHVIIRNFRIMLADVALGKGLKVPEVCRQLEISEQTYYRWRTKYGGMDPLMAKQMKATGEGERPAQEAAGRGGAGQGDSEGSRTPKLIDPERRRRAVDAVRRRLGYEKVSERRACKALNSAQEHAAVSAQAAGEGSAADRGDASDC